MGDVRCGGGGGTPAEGMGCDRETTERRRQGERGCASRGGKKRDASGRSEKERHAPSNRVDSHRSGVAEGQCRRSRRHPDGDPMAARDTRQPRQPRWQRRATTALRTVSKNILKLGVFPRSLSSFLSRSITRK